MKILIRNIAAITFLIASLVFAGAAWSQAWPGKPVRVIVPFAPGGPADIIARLVGQKLSEILGQPMVIDNRAGAGGNIGTVAAAKAPADGYTILITSSGFVVNVSFANPGYDAERDFIAIANVASQPNLIVVNPGVPAKTLAELIAFAKTSKLAYASPGSGTTPHLTAENLFKVLAGLDITPIHFRGAGPAVAAVVGGEPSVGSMAVAAPLPQVKAGRLRALAVSSSTRLAALPDVPTLTESGFPSLQDYTWIGVYLPAGTAPAIVQKLSESVNLAIQSPDFRARLEASGFDPVGGSLQQTADYVKAEIAKWAKVVRDTGAKPD